MSRVVFSSARPGEAGALISDVKQLESPFRSAERGDSCDARLERAVRGTHPESADEARTAQARITSVLGVLVTDGERRKQVESMAFEQHELELVRLLADGHAIATIARRLGVSERTLGRRTRTLCDRLGVESPIQVVVWAAKAGLL